MESTKKQLKALGLQDNDKSQYKADGLIKLYGIKNLEVLLLETSGSFNNSDKVKINFDHHKGTFGSLAMLKTVADGFCFASVETFKKLKVFFVHASGNVVLISMNNTNLSILTLHLKRHRNSSLEHSFPS